MEKIAQGHVTKLSKAGWYLQAASLTPGSTHFLTSPATHNAAHVVHFHQGANVMMPKLQMRKQKHRC